MTAHPAFANMPQRLRLMQDLKKLCSIEHHSPETLIKIGEFLSSPNTDDAMRSMIAKMISPNADERKEVMAVIDNQIHSLSQQVIEQVREARMKKAAHPTPSHPSPSVGPVAELSQQTTEVRVAETDADPEAPYSPPVPGAVVIPGELEPIDEDDLESDISEPASTPLANSKSYQVAAQQLIDQPPKVVPLVGVPDCEEYLHQPDDVVEAVPYSVIRLDSSEFPDLKDKNVVGIRDVFIGIGAYQVRIDDYALVIPCKTGVMLPKGGEGDVKLRLELGSGECLRRLNAHAVAIPGIAEFVAALNLLGDNYHFAINATFIWVDGRLIVAQEKGVEIQRYVYHGPTKNYLPLESSALTALQFATQHLRVTGVTLDILQ